MENLKRDVVLKTVTAIRAARSVFKDPHVCVSQKYAVATNIRQRVRNVRDLGIISFDCCHALQRALDY